MKLHFSAMHTKPPQGHDRNEQQRKKCDAAERKRERAEGEKWTNDWTCSGLRSTQEERWRGIMQHCSRQQKGMNKIKMENVNTAMHTTTHTHTGPAKTSETKCKMINCFISFAHCSLAGLHARAGDCVGLCSAVSTRLKDECKSSKSKSNAGSSCGLS